MEERIDLNLGCCSADAYTAKKSGTAPAPAIRRRRGGGTRARASDSIAGRRMGPRGMCVHQVLKRLCQRACVPSHELHEPVRPSRVVFSRAIDLLRMCMHML